ncbi:hypothetical protein DFJ73DRAFT_819329 [Zopfochytrium polystomum]|nr:hypothetical protein DFJ73DRAFT_819329 [Zopfochytrium polystomum]
MNIFFSPLLLLLSCGASTGVEGEEGLEECEGAGGCLCVCVWLGWTRLGDWARSTDGILGACSCSCSRVRCLCNFSTPARKRTR